MMRSLSVILLLFVVADLVLLATLKVSPIIGFGGHVLLSVGFFLVLRVWMARKNFQGVSTFLGLTFLLCLLAPFVGLLVVGVLALKVGDNSTDTDSQAGYVIGNPMRECEGTALSKSVELAPVINSLGRERFDQLVDEIAYLKSHYSEQAVSLLKRIRDKSNAMASLYANAALTVLSGEGESMVSSAQRKIQHGDFPEARYQLGSAYQVQALSGIVPGEEKESLLMAAIEQYGKNSGDQPSAVAMVQCALELEDADLASRLLANLERFPGSGPLIERMRQEVYALSGDWNSLRDSFNTMAGVDKASEFWLDSKLA